MARDSSDFTPIVHKADLISWFEAGAKRKEDFAFGVEHEKFPFYRATHEPVPYDGQGGEKHNGISALLAGLKQKTGWEAITEQGHIIGLYDPEGKGAVSLEPAGQFELSGAPLKTVHAVKKEFLTHRAALKAVADPLDIGFLLAGTPPLWALEDMPMMPKQRYEIMARYMPDVGTRGRNMMFRTATVQVNLDYASEADMVRKMRVAMALQPIVTALFANSPFLEGCPTGYQSMRAYFWQDTDNARSGILPFVFEEGFGFERYCDYALGVPMYFIKRGDVYHNVAGQSFTAFLEGRLPGFDRECVYLSDFTNHLSTIFPEVRLKRYLEMRGADMGMPAMVYALPALFAGLLYDATALDAAYDLIKDWRVEDIVRARGDVPRMGLAATLNGQSLQEIARTVLGVARGGLRRRAFLNDAGEDEQIYLAALEEIAQSGQTQAGRHLLAYDTAWCGDVAKLFDEAQF